MVFCLQVWVSSPKCLVHNPLEYPFLMHPIKAKGTWKDSTTLEGLNEPLSKDSHPITMTRLYPIVHVNNAAAVHVTIDWQCEGTHNHNSQHTAWRTQWVHYSMHKAALEPNKLQLFPGIITRAQVWRPKHCANPKTTAPASTSVLDAASPATNMAWAGNAWWEVHFIIQLLDCFLPTTGCLRCSLFKYQHGSCTIAFLWLLCMQHMMLSWPQYFTGCLWCVSTCCLGDCTTCFFGTFSTETTMVEITVIYTAW